MGADDAVGPFPANAFGGALGNYTTDFGTATATITDSLFDDNQALAGDGGIGPFAAIAGGGAVANDSIMEIVGSTFRHNRAVAGDNSVSDFHNGHALGGALNTGSLSPSAVPDYPGGELVVRRSEFIGNEAIGGNNNEISMDVPPADTPNNGYGGAILAYQGSIELLDSTVSHNRAIGGRSGTDQGGSLGVGGGVFLFNFLSLTDSSGLKAIVRGSTITHNAAIGGDGPVGGDGIGGGIASGTFGSVFAPGEGGHTEIVGTLVALNRAEGGTGDSGTGGDGLGGGIASYDGGEATVSLSPILFNRAVGGRGVQGGDGLGGGIYSAAMASTTLTHSVVFGNQAIGGHGRSGDDGLGLGGGIFIADGGLFQIDWFSRFWTRHNRASDAGDNVYGDLTIL